MCPRLLFFFLGWLGLFVLCWSEATAAEVAAATWEADAKQLASRVTIHRDRYGVPHVFGKDDESVLFGYGFAQAEDYFWQVEDVYIMALGRYAEVHGPRGLNSDLLNRGFEIVSRSRRDFAALDRTSQQLYAAFVAGINFYLETHPEEKPRMIRRFEPWHVLAYHRHVALELCFRFTGLSDSHMPRHNAHLWSATGSNGWAISGQRTASGHPMLLANPHMPWFGFAQLTEAHLHSEGGTDGKPWNFIGAGFYGSPMLVMGHNERLGWTLVTNEPGIADVWRVRFNDPENPLSYEYDGEQRTAVEWTEKIRVRKSRWFETRTFQLRKTLHGPIVAAEDDQTLLAAKISGLFDAVPMRQSLRMIKASNLEEFRGSLALMQMLYSNVLYADCDGNIFYVYNGRVPRRDPQFDWSAPVDGSNASTEWLGFHQLDEMPQRLNPASGFLQNCNSSPLTTTDGDNLRAKDFPAYMIRDIDQTRRRAERSREMLRAMHKVSFDKWQQAAFDTQVYWATESLPRYAKHFKQLQQDDPAAAAQVQPLLDHLLKWDKRITAKSTAATLCHAWYEQLYGLRYPGEQMRKLYRDRPAHQLTALVRASERLSSMHGTWKIPYGKLYRMQRQSRVADIPGLINSEKRFDDSASSWPSLAGHGPMGVVFTGYYSPSLDIPLIVSQKRRYGLVGTSYLAAYEFPAEGVRGVSVVPFGSSGRRDSPHSVDQADLLAAKRFKPELFTVDQVLQGAVVSYHPGERQPK